MQRPKFFVGTHQVNHAWQFERCMLSINRLENRKADFEANEWMMDSGAFTRIRDGKGHMPVRQYANHIERWSRCGTLVAAVAQDWMCEPFILNLTHRTVREHQRYTTRRYRSLVDRVSSTHVLPVLQGFTPEEYIYHLNQYGDDLTEGMWVGVGSVCKRNASPSDVSAVLQGIKERRPDLRLHGFGIKLTALGMQSVCEGFYSTDSMAWSYSARMNGRDGNSVTEALLYADRVDSQPVQLELSVN